jgi:hypothetical protein
MVKQKEDILFERKKHAGMSRNEKEKLTKVMEELRTNTSKANKIISKGLKSNVPLSSIVFGSDEKRASSAGPKTKRKTKASTLGFPSRDSSSADHNASFFESNESTSPVINGGHSKLYSAPDESKPFPYVSPYEQSSSLPALRSET